MVGFQVNLLLLFLGIFQMKRGMKNNKHVRLILNQGLPKE